MSPLRSRVIRLAHRNPSLRPHLLPLLKSAALPPAKTWLETVEGKVFHQKGDHWFVPTTPTKSGTAKGMLVSWDYGYSRKPEKAKQSSFSERELSSPAWKMVTASDIPPEVVDRFHEKGIRVASTREARVTQELLRVRYSNLGDFGGTDPVEDSWVLEVAGPTFEHREVLKRLGFRWNPNSKTWVINATLYKYGGRRNAEFYKNRKLQETAYPVVRELAKKYNEEAEAHNNSVGPNLSDPREINEHWSRIRRTEPKLTAAGIKIERINPSRYDVSESKVSVTGNTFPLASIMKKHGWRWNPAERAWVMPGPEFFAIQDKWMGDVVRELPSRPEPVVPAVFSEMSQRELADWVSTHFDYEDLTEDGERDERVGISQYMTYLKSLSPEEQQKFYAARNRLYGR